MLLKKLMRKYRSFVLASKGAALNGTIQSVSNFFEGYTKGFKAGKAIFIENGAKFIISKMENIDPKLEIGDYFYMNSYSIIDCHYKITIGSRVQIGPHCYIADFDHDLKVDIRQPLHRMHEKCAAVFIKDNVWIGSGVTVLKGVTIGKNSVIGAGSVVTHDIPDNVVAIGIPARVVKVLEGNYDESE